MKYDYSLYLVTDRRCMSAPTLCEAVGQAILGGVTMVQLREEGISSLDFYRLAKEVKAVTKYHQVPLIINNRADIAFRASVLCLPDIPVFHQVILFIYDSTFAANKKKCVLVIQ